MYNYGAPRVGNAEFANYFESLFAGREVRLPPPTPFP